MWNRTPMQIKRTKNDERRIEGAKAEGGAGRTRKVFGAFCADLPARQIILPACRHACRRRPVSFSSELAAPNSSDLRFRVAARWTGRHGGRGGWKETGKIELNRF